METKATKKEKIVNKKRIWEIDFLRGLAIFLMLFDHLAYDFLSFNSFFVNASQINNPFVNQLIKIATDFELSSAREVLHLIFSALFFVLCGISSYFSHNNFKRALQILGCCLILDGATYILYFVSDKSIDVRMIFNVLFSLGIGVLLVAILSYLPCHRKLYLFLGAVILCFAFSYDSFHPVWYNEFDFSMTLDIFLGKKAFGSDCFSLIHVGYVFIGAYLGETLYSRKESLVPSFDGKWNRFFLFIGKHTMPIYLLHQVVFALVVGILGLCLGYRLF